MEDNQKVISVIKKAGKAILELYHSDYEVYRKADRSPVTEADILADEIIATGLREFGYPILSEESEDDLSRMKAERVWIVDSLDGTQDFLDKTDEFCVMIGLSEKGKSIGGWVYIPPTDKLYYAQKGQGAYIQVGSSAPVQIHVSDQTDIHKAKLLVSRTHLSRPIEEAAKKLGVGEMVLCGSNGVKMGLVAEGAVDLFFNPTDKFGQWDCCAPQIIVEEAGGRVSGVRGEELTYNGKELKNPYGMLASNAILHEHVVDVF